MVGINVNSLPYQRKISYQMIKYLRLTRNLTQEKFGEVCKIDRSVLAKLERGELAKAIGNLGDMFMFTATKQVLADYEAKKTTLEEREEVLKNRMAQL